MSDSRPLRLLMITNTPWCRDLGAARVYTELAEEFLAQGQVVEKFSWEDAFPSPQREGLNQRRGMMYRVLGALSGSRDFSARARRHVRATAGRFDVIDAGHTDLPFPKQDLRFAGLLVARSVAFTPAYRDFERFAARRWPEPPSLKRLISRALFYPRQRRHLRNWPAALRHADAINVSNRDDFRVVSDELGYQDKALCLPFGLSEARFQALREQRAGVADRLAGRSVVFIGTWNPRKGARDWPLIVRSVCARLPETRFLFLGTDVGSAAVIKDFPPEVRGSIQVRSRFDGDDLPELLRGATVGAFPGYLEGFGFAVLEKLAAGLPTVAYDAPGPREILQHQRLSTTVPPGEVGRFADLLLRLLTLDAETYRHYSEDGTEVAARFRWRDIARQTLEAYAERWRALRRPAR
jgi:glycosyltransferase involved in cell wall biosynthesis